MQNYGKLTLILPDGGERVFRLTGPTMTLGREVDNDIVLVDEKVSRHHARLECNDQGCVLIDTGSANGIFVDGQQVERVTLVAGNTVKLGQSTLRFESDQVPKKASRRARPDVAAKNSLDQVARANENAWPEVDPALAEAALPDNALHIPRLVVHIPQKGWQEMLLTDQDVWTIGRDPDSDIVIDHQKVSRYHARVERQGDGFVIRDMDSSNGTWFGYRQIKTHRLQHTDTLNIGHAQLVFKSAGQVEIEWPTASHVSTPTPVIIVPGSFGSSLWRGSEQIWPSVRNLLTSTEKLYLSETEPLEARSVVGEVVVVPKLFKIPSYSRIGNYLEKELNYTRGKDFLEFAYDWRLDVRLAAQRLAEFVDHWAVNQPLTLVAHSLGCLVSRYYVDCLGGQQKVGRLILMGGPNYGTAAGLTNALPDHLHHYLPPAFSMGNIGKNFFKMLSSFPASIQLLPAYPCVFDQDDQIINVYQDETWLAAEKRPLLEVARELHAQLNRTATVPTICIAGYGTQTMTRIVVERDRQGRWQSLEFISDDNGDGVVETKSALLEGAEIHPVQQDHNSLYVDEDVLMRLKLELKR